MPKISGTRKQKAEELFRMLSRGPSFSHMAAQRPYTTEDARQSFEGWSESWILTDLCKLIPELKGKLGKLGYVEAETIAEARKRR